MDGKLNWINGSWLRVLEDGWKVEWLKLKTSDTTLPKQLPSDVSKKPPFITKSHYPTNPINNIRLKIKLTCSFPVTDGLKVPPPWHPSQQTQTHWNYDMNKTHHSLGVKQKNDLFLKLVTHLTRVTCWIGVEGDHPPHRIVRIWHSEMLNRIISILIIQPPKEGSRFHIEITHCHFNKLPMRF